MSVFVHDLLGREYKPGGTGGLEGIDCLWAVRQVLPRIFPDFDGRELPESAIEERAAIEDIEKHQSRWVQVGTTAAAANKLGDVLYTEHKDKGEVKTGVAVVVDASGRLALTALPGFGGHLLQLRRLGTVKAVFRRGPPR